MKLRYWFAIALGVIVAVIIAGGAVLFQTQAGLQWAIEVAENHSGGMISVGAAKGKLAGPLTLEDLRITLSGAVITAKQVRLDWNPTALAAGKLGVTRLRGADIRIVTRPTNKEKPFSLPEKIHLPLHIIVRSARFTNLRLQGAGHALQLDRLGFALDADDERIRLNSFETRGPRIALGGELRLEAHGNWPLTARLAEILRPAGYPAVEGRTRLDGGLRGSVKLEQTLHAPFSAALSAHIANLFASPRIEGRLRIDGFDPHAIKPAWPRSAVSAHLDFAGDVHGFNVHGTLALAGKRRHSVKLDLEAGLSEKQLRIAHLNLAIVHEPGRLALRGTIARNAEHTADLAIAWRALQWPIMAPRPGLRLPAGGAHLAGSLDGWTLHATSLLQTGELPRGRWALDARGNKREITINGLVGRWLGGRIAAAGHVNLAGSRGFRLAVNSRGLRPDTVAASLHGHLGFALTANGELKPLHAHVLLTRLDGQLNGHSLTGKADLDWASDNVNVHALTVAAGPNHVTVAGRWGKTLDLSWQLNAPRLATLGDGFGGRLSARGKLTGSAKAPRIRASLDGDKLRWRDVSIARAAATVNVALSAQTPSSLDVRLTRVTRGDLAFDGVTLMLGGPAQAEHFELAVNGKQGNLDLAGSGRFDAGVWRGKLTKGILKPAQAPEFTLRSPAAFALGARELRLARGCWQASQDAQFCLAAASGNAGWQAAFELDRLPLALANAYLSQGVKLHGRLDGKLTASGGRGKLNLDGNLRAEDAGITRRINGSNQSLAFSRAALTVHMNETTATARLDLETAKGGTLSANAEIPWRVHAEPAGRIHLVAHLPDLSGLGALSDTVSDVAGRLDADFTVSGSLDAPSFRGTARLSQGAFNLNRFGTRIRDASLTLAGEGPRLHMSGGLSDGAGGTVNLRGTLARETDAWALNMHVAGKNFRVADIPEARIRVSPDLDIGLAERALSITGAITIPSAHIEPPNFAAAVTPTPDLVIVGAKQAEGKPPLKLAARITLRLGNDVHFEGYGLTARIGGELTLNEKPGKLTTARGELKVLDGHYKAYGQDLTIHRGRLLFSGGPIANPGLDIRATRRVGLVTTGLQVTGTLRNPRLRVFSNPPMSQSEALAYLLFGHGVQQNNGQENSLYQQAAGAIGIAGGTYLAKSLTKHVGIDTVSVENASRYSTDSDQASLFLGKYLSPRLYVSYGIGLYQPINLLRIRYTLSRHWALEAESGSFTGADILFNIEP